ncbi:MAG: hypothetical protein U5L11_12735 [Arhodomonas sp.]|nr:hypothetical protein [Arhodomonas sp.]
MRGETALRRPSNRPERKNPLTFDSYAELRDTVPRPGLCRRRARRW